jgi:hypothetical protein
VIPIADTSTFISASNSDCVSFTKGGMTTRVKSDAATARTLCEWAHARVAWFSISVRTDSLNLSCLPFIGNVGAGNLNAEGGYK